MLVAGDSHPTYQRLGLSLPAANEPLPPKSVHTRKLPEALVAFSSERGRGYFAEAMASGHMLPYFPLIEQFVTQEEPTFCGLGTLTMVMNALRIDPRRRWHDESGPGWRWWSDEMFPTSCSGSLDRIRAAGITMDEFATLASANGAAVTMRRPTDAGESLESFRAAIVDAASTDRATFTVASFDRASLGQTGGGHFSPIGGYHAPSDSALVLDVARFKYPPYWVALPQLWQAALVPDELTGHARGWFHLSPNADVLPRDERRGDAC